MRTDTDIMKTALVQIVTCIKNTHPLSMSDRELLRHVRVKAEIALSDAASAATRVGQRRYLPEAGAIGETGTTVDYDEEICQFSVKHNGEVIDWFRSRTEAEAFAATYDELPKPSAARSQPSYHIRRYRHD